MIRPLVSSSNLFKFMIARNTFGNLVPFLKHIRCKSDAWHIHTLFLQMFFIHCLDPLQHGVTIRSHFRPLLLGQLLLGFCDDTLDFGNLFAHLLHVGAVLHFYESWNRWCFNFLKKWKRKKERYLVSRMPKSNEWSFLIHTLISLPPTAFQAKP